MNPLVNDNLIETRNNLVQEITLLNDVHFNSKPDMDMWSIAQVCYHLVLVEESTIKAIEWGLKVENCTEQKRKNIDHILMDRSKKRKAPKIVEPGVMPFEVQQMIDLLNTSRGKLLTLLSSIEDKSILVEKSVKHPALGELLLDQWIEQIYLHEQRHIEQIKEIKLFLEKQN